MPVSVVVVVPVTGLVVMPVALAVVVPVIGLVVMPVALAVVAPVAWLVPVPVLSAISPLAARQVSVVIFNFSSALVEVPERCLIPLVIAGLASGFECSAAGADILAGLRVPAAGHAALRRAGGSRAAERRDQCDCSKRS